MLSALVVITLRIGLWSILRQLRNYCLKLERNSVREY